MGLLLLLLGPGACLGAGARDFADGWLLGPGAVARLLGRNGEAPGGVWLSAGQSRLFGLAELPVLALEAGWRRPAWPGQPSCVLSWQRLGDALYLEDSRQVHLQFGRTPVLGLAVGQVLLTTGPDAGDPVPALAVWQAALTLQWNWQPAPVTELRLLLWLALAEADEAVLSRARRPLLRVEGWRGRAGLAAALDLKADQAPALGLEVALGSGPAAWGLRLEPETGVVGPVFYWLRGGLQVATSHLTHPQLGVTHRFRMGFGNWGAPRW